MTLVHLRSATTSFVAVTDGDALPVVLHWGARLPETIGEAEILAATRAVVPHSSTDQPLVRRLVPLPVDGWRLRPALSGSYADGTHFAPRFTAATVESDDRHLRVVANDPGTGLRVESAYTLHADGLLEIATEVTNDGPGVFLLASCESSLPIPVEVTEVLDLTGRWCRERSPQRLTLPMGSWMRESRHGRTGHDAPLALCVGDPGFGFRSGRVWAIHLGWSGDSRVYAERSPGGFAQVGAGELVAPGEVILAPGQSYAAPPLFAAFSDRGLDGISAAFHGFVRSRATHPSTPRKVLLNTWEAVYFDHRLEVLTDLADKAADAGIERFVLDDGWFGGRRNDGRGLGDWYVSPEVWPDGLTPLIEHVRSRGMDFGLWVEPEMANPDSDLVREHPEWLLAVPGRDPLLWRRQQVVDLANPDCFAHILDRLDAILRDNDIAFLKWDHNRDLIDAAHEGRPAVRVQTLALYALLDELRRRHPEVEIETCASGGGRVDLGVLARTDRLWASDTIDALERQQINLWTSLVVPPELIGSHIGGPHSHTTGRHASFALRAASAVFWHMGVEWNVATLDDAELAMLRTAITWHQAHRELLHSGEVVRLDTPGRRLVAHGVVARDGAEAVFSVARLATDVGETRELLRLDALDPQGRYAVSPAFLGEVPTVQQLTWPEWVDHPGVEVSGAVLMEVGLSLPNLHPEQAILIHLRRV
jgi:alpha-galactosidase